MNPRFAAVYGVAGVLIALAYASWNPARSVNAQAVGTVTANLPCYIGNGTGTPGTAAPYAANCRDRAGTLRGYRIINTSGTAAWLKFYNLKTMPVCNSANGFIEAIPIGALTAPARWGIVDVVSFFFYNQGIGFCITGGTGFPNDGSPPHAGIYGVVSTGN